MKIATVKQETDPVKKQITMREARIERYRERLIALRKSADADIAHMQKRLDDEVKIVGALKR